MAALAETRLVVRPFWMVRPLTEVWTWPFMIMWSIGCVVGNWAIVTW